MQMTKPLRLTIDYEESEGQIIARVREIPAAFSFGATREEAREAALDALRELALSYVDPASTADAPGDVIEILAQTR